MIDHLLLEEIADIYNLLKNIKQEYNNGIKPILLKNDSIRFKNIHMIPRLTKIQINRGIGLDIQKTSKLKNNINEFEIITGQKPIVTKAKKSISTFQIRKNMELGLSVTLRGEKMYTFLIKLLFFTFSQIRDFRGLSLRSFDKSGNFSFGLKEQGVFPEIRYDTENSTEGFTINIVLKQSLPQYKNKSIERILNGIILFKFLRFPLYEFGYYEKYSKFSDIKNNWEKKRFLKRKRWSQ